MNDSVSMDSGSEDEDEDESENLSKLDVPDAPGEWPDIGLFLR